MNKNNRKNNGKLYDAKIKLIKAQNTRKLLYKLHNIDDGTLDTKISVNKAELQEQE